MTTSKICRNVKMARAIGTLAGIGALVLAACSDVPKCNDSSTACTYEHFLFEGTRMPPTYSRADDVLASDMEMKRIPSLVDATELTETNALSVSALLRTAFEHHPTYCRLPAFRTLLERFHTRAMQLPHHDSIESNLAAIDCPPPATPSRTPATPRSAAPNAPPSGPMQR